VSASSSWGGVTPAAMSASVWGVEAQAVSNKVRHRPPHDRAVCCKRVINLIDGLLHEGKDVGVAEDIRRQEDKEDEYDRAKEATAGRELIHLLVECGDFFIGKGVNAGLNLLGIDTHGDELFSKFLSFKQLGNLFPVHLGLLLFDYLFGADHGSLGRGQHAANDGEGGNEPFDQNTPGYTQHDRFSDLSLFSGYSYLADQIM
jgi:hypothetical protein